MVDKKLNHSLLSNGLDFIESGLSGITAKEIQRVKYGILHLFAGVVLVLKERIKQEHWSLLFLKSEQANLKKYQSGDFVSIDYATVLTILANVCQIEISQAAKSSMEELRKTRNKIEHFEFEITPKTIKPIAARVLVFVVDFIKKNFDVEEFSEDEQEIFEQIKEKAREFKAYIDVKLTDLAEYAAKNKKDVFHCPDCYEKALVREDDDFQCFICELEGVDVDNVVEEHLDRELGLDSYSAAKDGYDLPVHNCGECLADALVPSSVDYKQFVCINCGDRVDSDNLHSCSRCGVVFYAKDGSSICTSCWEDVSSRD